MAENPQTGGGLSDLVRLTAPYAPVVGGALLSMWLGEQLTVRGKALSAAVGLAMALWVAPWVVDLIALAWPGGSAPGSLAPVVGFACGVCGMTLLSGLLQAIARYSRDPLRLVRITVGPVTITGGLDEEAAP